MIEDLTRSPITGPSPLGVGTVEVESFTGYFLRLAAWHKVTPRQMRFIDLPKQFSEGFEKEIQAFRRYPYLNLLRGKPLASPTGRNLAIAVGKLTGRASVEDTVFETFRGQISVERIIRRSHMWCPHCLREDEEPYDRLIWNMANVTTCAKHAIQLQSSCIHCGTLANRGLHEGSAYNCSNCGQNVFTGDKIVDIKPASEGSLKAAQDLTAFFSAVFERRLKLETLNLASDLRWFCEELHISTQKEQAIALGTTKGCLSGWYSGAHEVNLPRFLELCTHVGVAPLDIVTRTPHWDLEKLNLGERQGSRFWKREPSCVRRYDKRAVETKILAMQKRNPSLNTAEIVKLLDLPYLSVRRLIRPLAQQIDKDASMTKRSLRPSEEENYIKEIDYIINDLLADGFYPSKRRICARMHKPGAVKSPTIRRHMKKRLAETSQHAVLQFAQNQGAAQQAMPTTHEIQ